MAAGKKKQTPAKQSRRIQLELTPVRLCLYAGLLLAVMGWMFVFGVLVGRGLPMASPTETTWTARLWQFLGLTRTPPEFVEHASRTWTPPDEMLRSLDYYRQLEQPRTRPQEVLTPEPLAPPAKPSAPAQPAPDQPGTPSEPIAPAENGEQYYTLMVASLRNPQNAEELVARLQQQGYPAQMETVSMPEDGIWHRVLVGHYETREEALAFAARFNRERGMEGLVLHIKPPAETSRP